MKAGVEGKIIFLSFQVAKHLASTYGDKAFKVAKLATLTGKRWPVSGKRLHEEFPYLEAEVRLNKITHSKSSF